MMIERTTFGVRPLSQARHEKNGPTIGGASKSPPTVARAASKVKHRPRTRLDDYCALPGNPIGRAAAPTYLLDV